MEPTLIDGIAALGTFVIFFGFGYFLGYLKGLDK